MKTTKCQSCNNECFIVYGDNIMKCSRCGEQWGIAVGLENNHYHGGHSGYACIMNYHEFERVIFRTDKSEMFEIIIDIPAHIRRSIDMADALRTGLPKCVKFFLDYGRSDFEKKILYYYSECDYRHVT